MVLANAVEQAYDFNPQLATADVRQEVEDAVRDGRKDCCDAKGNLVCRYSIEPAWAERLIPPARLGEKCLNIDRTRRPAHAG